MGYLLFQPSDLAALFGFELTGIPELSEFKDVCLPINSEMSSVGRVYRNPDGTFRFKLEPLT